jgi:hypothetical protein
MFTPCVLIYLKAAFEVISSRIAFLYFYKTSDFTVQQRCCYIVWLTCTSKILYRNSKRIYSQQMNRAATVPIPTFMFLCAIYIFPRLVCLFCCRKIDGQIVEMCNGSQTHECRNWDWGRAVLFWEYINRNFFVVYFRPSTKVSRREDLIARRIREKSKLGVKLELHHPRRIKFTIVHFCSHLTIKLLTLESMRPPSRVQEAQLRALIKAQPWAVEAHSYSWRLTKEPRRLTLEPWRLTCAVDAAHPVPWMDPLCSTKSSNLGLEDRGGSPWSSLSWPWNHEGSPWSR